MFFFLRKVVIILLEAINHPGGIRGPDPGPSPGHGPVHPRDVQAVIVPLDMVHLVTVEAVVGAARVTTKAAPANGRVVPDPDLTARQMIPVIVILPRIQDQIEIARRESTAAAAAEREKRIARTGKRIRYYQDNIKYFQ